MTDVPERRTGLQIARNITVALLFCWGFLAFCAALSPTEEERAAAETERKAASAMTTMIADCAAQEGPWRCFVKLEALDAAEPLDGRTRLQHLARMVPAWQVLAFCTEPRFVDCADRMVGKAYSRDEILAAIGE